MEFQKKFTFKIKMMSFAGHVLDMINRQKLNDALKSKKKDRFDKIKDSQNSSSKKLFAIKKKNLSEKELLEIKTKYKQLRNKEKLKEIIFVLIIVVVFGSLISFFAINFLF